MFSITRHETASSANISYMHLRVDVKSVHKKFMLRYSKDLCSVTVQQSAYIKKNRSCQQRRRLAVVQPTTWVARDIVNAWTRVSDCRYGMPAVVTLRMVGVHALRQAKGLYKQRGLLYDEAYQTT